MTQTMYTPGAEWLDDSLVQVADFAPLWTQWLARSRQAPFVTGLQVGAHHGNTAGWLLSNILTHPDARLICVDSEFGPEFWRNTAPHSWKVEPIQGEGVDLRFRKDLIGRLDFAYLDGSHDAKSYFETAVVAYRLLTVHGVMVFDDYFWYPTRDPGAQAADWPDTGLRHADGSRLAIDAFLSIYLGRYRLLHQEHQVAIEKLVD